MEQLMSYWFFIFNTVSLWLKRIDKYRVKLQSTFDTFVHSNLVNLAGVHPTVSNSFIHTHERLLVSQSINKMHIILQKLRVLNRFYEHPNRTQMLIYQQISWHRLTHFSRQKNTRVKSRRLCFWSSLINAVALLSSERTWSDAEYKTAARLCLITDRWRPSSCRPEHCCWPSPWFWASVWWRPQSRSTLSAGSSGKVSSGDTCVSLCF